MKSKFFLFALSAVALTACTSEDVVDDVASTKNAIRFENVVNKHSRAEGDLNTDNLTHFNVFGYYTTPENNKVAVPVFEDTDVRLDPTFGVWKNDGETRFWVKGGHYYFFAYSCGSVSQIDQTKYTDTKFSMDMKNDIAPSDRVLIIQNYVCDYTHQHDLIYASNIGGTAEDPWSGIVATENGNPDVAFQFKHILSKVNAEFTSKFPAGYEVAISNITLENIRNVGSYNPTDGGTWSPVTRLNKTSRNYVYLLKTEDKEILPITTTAGGDNAVTPYAYVIPYTYTTSAEDATETGVNLKFHILVSNKGQAIFEKDMIGNFNPNWKPGFKYTYNVEVSGESTHLQAIVFTTTTDEEGNVVSNWGDGTDNVEFNLQEIQN